MKCVFLVSAVSPLLPPSPLLSLPLYTFAKIKQFIYTLPLSHQIKISNMTGVILKMKQLLDQQQHPSPATASNGSVAGSNLYDFWYFVKGMDFNPARMIMAEMVGTFILMFCVCGIIASTQILKGQVGLLEYASTAGLTVVVLIFSIGSISGAHVNPAVTVAFATFGHFPWPRVPFYILSQTIGSILATYIGKSVYGIDPDLMATRPLQNCASSFWVEFIATFIIMFVASALTFHAQSVGYLSGLVIGISIALAVLITGPISGGSMNPARSLGPAIVAWNFKDVWVYITAPIAGALAGAMMFNALNLRPQSSPSPCTATSSASTDAGLLVHTIAFADG
ncbi:Probable aquaporin NIP7-1 [Linum grandiflorum]